VYARNCIDTKKTTSIGGAQVHLCEFLQTAMADASTLDFSQAPAEDKAPEDPFAEMHIGYHALRVYQWFQTFQAGFKVQEGPLDVVANMRTPPGVLGGDPADIGNPNVPLEPLQNAFYSPPGDVNILTLLLGIKDGGLYFGQGPVRDYSYDGDVIYHEFS